MHPLIFIRRRVRAVVHFFSRARQACELHYRWKFSWAKAIDIAWSWR